MPSGESANDGAAAQPLKANEPLVSEPTEFDAVLARRANAPAEAAGERSSSDAEADLIFRKPLARPSFYERRRAILRGVVLILATVLSLLGTLGQFYFVDAAQKTVDARTEEMRAIETRTETLRTAQSAYFNAQVQGNLLFALNPADRSVNKGVVGDLYSLAIYDRAFPFRSILGELAIAGAIDFKKVNAEYNALREAALKDFSYETFTAVGEFEHQNLEQAMALHGRLQDRFWKAAEEKALAETAAERRRALLLAIAGAATCLFLIANLMGVKD